jgi:hypothetical protein
VSRPDFSECLRIVRVIHRGSHAAIAAHSAVDRYHLIDPRDPSAIADSECPLADIALADPARDGLFGAAVANKRLDLDCSGYALVMSSATDEAVFGC